jgi:hypothetical protein
VVETRTIHVNASAKSIIKPSHVVRDLRQNGVEVRIPRDGDQRSELMSITIPK